MPNVSTGTVNSVAAAGGKMRIAFAADYGWAVGDRFHISGNTDALANVWHEVVTVVSPTSIDSNVAYGGLGGSNGTWKLGVKHPASYGSRQDQQRRLDRRSGRRRG